MTCAVNVSSARMDVTVLVQAVAAAVAVAAAAANVLVSNGTQLNVDIQIHNTQVVSHCGAISSALTSESKWDVSDASDTFS